MIKNLTITLIILVTAIFIPEASLAAPTIDNDNKIDILEISNRIQRLELEVELVKTSQKELSVLSGEIAALEQRLELLQETLKKISVQNTIHSHRKYTYTNSFVPAGW